MSREIPLKQWLAEQAERMHLSARHVRRLFDSGKVQPAQVRRVNKRVILVTP